VRWWQCNEQQPFPCGFFTASGDSRKMKIDARSWIGIKCRSLRLAQEACRVGGRSRFRTAADEAGWVIRTRGDGLAASPPTPAEAH
jgi:hypothetical protein